MASGPRSDMQDPMRTWFSVLLPAAVLWLPSVALAGGCPTCTTDADCVPPGGGAGFCVEWSRDFGCGTQRIACCPGQGCDTFSGRPSCEGADRDGDGVDDCAVLGADAGVPGTDAGPAGTDAGPVGTDAGPGGTDAGSSGGDAGPTGLDAGPTMMTDGGCGCRVGARSSGPGLALVGLVAFVALARRSRSSRG